MRRFRLFSILLAAALMAAIAACKSVPAESPADEETGVVAAEVENVSGSVAISQQMYDETLIEVRAFVDHLNTVIQNKNYNSWVNALSSELFAEISSPAFLAERSESVLLRSRNITLRTPNDYFMQVVVPSRSNSVVDEIEFVNANRVKVFFRDKTPSGETRRLRLYELIKIGDTWKILQ
jgi:hypothetical protein